MSWNSTPEGGRAQVRNELAGYAWKIQDFVA